MVPLIDVVLVLLVIFIVTAPLLTHAVKLDLPKAVQCRHPKPEKVEFSIDATGALFWTGERQAARKRAEVHEEGRNGHSPKSICAPTRASPTASSPRPSPMPRMPASARSPSSAAREEISASATTRQAGRAAFLASCLLPAWVRQVDA